MLNTFKLRGLITSFMTIVSLFAIYANDYDKGWSEFNNNNRVEARKYFQQAINNSDTKAKAYLSLSLLDWSEYRFDDAFVSFTKFYDTSDNPYPYLYAMYSLPFMNQFKVLPKAELTFWEKVVEDPKMNGTLKAMIYSKLGDHYQACNNTKKSKELFSKMGALNNWQVLGSFENISGSGFNKNWGALEKAKPTDVFKDQVEADVRWYTPPVNKPNNWFYFDYYFRLNSVIVYAQTFVTSDKEQDVYFKTGTSGSLKIWLNDVQIASIPEERNCDLDIYGYKAHLNKGVNRILVQIGQSEISGANFMLRITDEQAHPVQGITHSPVYADYSKSTASNSNDILPFFAEEYLNQKIKEEPNNLVNYIALGETYLRNDKAYEGTHILKEAERLAPKSSLVALRLSEAYLRSKNNTDYSREIENIKLNDPDSYTALQSKFEEAVGMEKISEAERIRDKVKQLYGESLATTAMDVQIINLQRNIEQLVKISVDLYKKYPHVAEYMEMCYVIEEDLNGNQKGAIAIAEDFCKKYSSPAALDVLYGAYMKKGETEKALKILQKKIDDTPYAIGYIYNYATTLQGLQRYDEALKQIDRALQLAPYMDYLYNTQGYIYKEQKKMDAAKESFRKAIYYGPTSYDSRKQLRLLENKKEVFDLFPQIDLDALISKAPGTAEYPDQNSVIVLNNNELVFYPEGAQESRTELAIRVLNQTGIEDWKDYQIGYNGNSQRLLLDKYEVIKTNGQKVKAETNNQGRVVFTNLEIGDVLHLEYRIQSYFGGILSKHFYDQKVFQLATPSMMTKYSIFAPKDKKFDWKITNSDIKPVITEIEGMKLYEWTSTDQTAVKDEPYMSAYIDAVPSLTFSSIPNWEFVSEWYRDMTANKFGAHSDYILKNTTTEILKGKENVTQLEKAKLFYDYILNNITYSNVPFMQSNFIPQKASRTISTRLGDCKDVSTLFVAFCRESGIKANLVLISTRENGRNKMLLPTNAFNHCIVSLEVDNKVYYLELTDNKLPFSAIPEMDLKANILPIPYLNEKSSEKILVMDMPFRLKNEIKRRAKVAVSGNDMNIALTSVRFGQLASYYRQYYNDMGTEDRLKNMNRSVASDWTVPVTVSNLSFSNLDNLKDSVVYNYTVDVKNGIQDVAGMKIFKFPWTDAITSLSFVSLDTRKYPLEFWTYIYSDREEEQIEMILPAGTQFVESPKNIKLDCAVASYELIFNTDKSGKITAERIFTKKKDLLLPEEYAEFKNFITQISESENKQYAIK